MSTKTSKPKRRSNSQMNSPKNGGWSPGYRNTLIGPSQRAGTIRSARAGA
jgi:hypothetical protein